MAKINKMTLNLMVPDVEEAIKFYRDALDFNVTLTVPESGTKNFAILETGGIELMLQSKESLATDIPVVGSKDLGASVVCYMDVEDIRGLYNKLKKMKVKIVKPIGPTFYGMTEFYIEDPHGYVLGFAERES